MGERCAYRASKDGKSFFMIRKQWYLGSSHEKLTDLIRSVAENLLRGIRGRDALIGDGLVALRDDLGLGRLTMALVNAVSLPPFDEIVEDGNLNCDINDHGIYEIELVKWNQWNLNQYNVEYPRDKNGHPTRGKSYLGEKKHLATVEFIKGQPLDTGMKITFHVPDDWEYPERKDND